MAEAETMGHSFLDLSALGGPQRTISVKSGSFPDPSAAGVRHLPIEIQLRPQGQAVHLLPYSRKARVVAH